jgi:hypothetical protein
MVAGALIRRSLVRHAAAPERGEAGALDADGRASAGIVLSATTAAATIVTATSLYDGNFLLTISEYLQRTAHRAVPAIRYSVGLATQF